MSGTSCFKLSQLLNKQNEPKEYRGRKYSNICSKFCIIGSKPSVFSGQDANMVCPQRTEFSPSDVSGRQSLDLRSCSSCVVSFVHREVVFTPQCTNLCSPELKKPLR